MVDLYQIETNWTFENGQGGTSVMYASTGTADVAFIRASLATFFAACEPSLDSLTTWTIRTTGDVVDSASGVLVGDWAEGTSRTGAGNLSGQPLANATQILVQWRTGAIINGRRVRGRTFIPGVGALAADGGQLAAARQTEINVAADALVAALTPQFGVWHRPTSGSGGDLATITDGTAWTEFAVQRRRR